MDNNDKGHNMKGLLRILTPILIVFACVIFCVGCKAGLPISIDSDEDVNQLKGRVAEMIDYIAARDFDGAYSMLYPGVTDKDNFDLIAEQIYEYFPATEGYTLEIIQWDKYTGSNIDSNFIKADYKVEFDESVFYIGVTWRYNNDGNGFTQFQVANEKDAQGN